MSITENGQINPYYEHIKLNPYLLTIIVNQETRMTGINLELKKECFLTKLILNT